MTQFEEQLLKSLAEIKDALEGIEESLSVLGVDPTGAAEAFGFAKGGLESLNSIANLLEVMSDTNELSED